MIRTPLAALFALTLMAGAAPSALSQDAMDDPVIAIVEGVEIKRSELEEARIGLPPQVQQIPTEQLFEPLVQRVIDARLLSVRAEAAGIEDDPIVAAALEAARRNALSDQYLRREVEAMVTDEAVRAAYDEAAEAGDYDKDEVHARHILLETEEDALAVIEALDGGADFAELAAERSTGPSGPDGGDLGYFTKAMMVEPFAEAAFALEAGAVTEAPVETQFGWHVIEVMDKRSGATPFEEVELQLRQGMLQEAVGQVVAAAREGASIEIFGIDGDVAADDDVDGADAEETDDQAGEGDRY